MAVSGMVLFFAWPRTCHQQSPLGHLVNVDVLVLEHFDGHVVKGESNLGIVRPIPLTFYFCST